MVTGERGGCGGGEVLFVEVVVLVWFESFGLRIELIWKFFGDGRWSGGPTLGWEQDWLKEWGE